MLVRALVFIAGFLVPVASQAAEQIDFGRYHALVIGSNEYEHLQNLETAVSDATAVAEVLKTKYGFEVTLKLNATRRDILSEINRLRTTLTEKDRLLVYYAGHGQLDRAAATGYWLPVDAKPDDDTDWIANEALSRHFLAMSVQHIMVVADSCYSGTLLRGSSAAPRGISERGAWLRRIAGTRSRTALTSGGLEPVADTGIGGHSVFANALLRTLRENDSILDGHSLAKTVAQRVAWNAEQIPQYSDIRMAGHESGDFIFVPVGADLSVTVTVRPADKQPVDERAMELAFWEAIKASSETADYEAYLTQYPEGTFAALARNRLKKLKEEQTAVVVTPPKPPSPPTAVLPDGMPGPRPAVRAILDRALALAEGVSDAYDQAGVLAVIAKRQAEAGNVDGARRTIRAAVAAAERISHAPQRGWVLGDIAVAEVKAGDVEGARRTLQAAVATAERSSDAINRGSVFRTFSVAQARAGDVEGALRTAERVPEADQRALAFAWIAKALVQADRAAGRHQAAK